MLKIYSASAGSGKTHLLTKQYLLLLLADGVDFRRVLAVTFTNKATDEMKNRIVEELYKLATDPESSLFFGDLQERKKRDPVKLQRKARQILQHILHDYSSFSVSTIDKFFQQILRSFTREIGLNEGYTLELDTDKSLEIIIDRMYASLGEKENVGLLNWLIDFSENKLEEGSSWNVKGNLAALSKELFKEAFRLNKEAIRAEIEDKEKLRNFRKELNTIQNSFREKLKEVGCRALKIMDDYALIPTQFKGGSNSQMKRFHAFAQGEVVELKETFRQFYDNVDGWYAKTTTTPVVAAIEAAYHAGLNNCVGDILRLYDEEIVYYNTARVIDKSFFRLALLGDISRHLTAYADEKNLLFIQDTTELLNRIAGNADAPFIYEKVGTRIDHYMIDEFQDTSNMQWQNFLPLLKESLSANRENLIVGDVKQSIYRFRNSDWRLLNEEVGKALQQFPQKREPLETNWRSNEVVVDFNNRFFEWVKNYGSGGMNDVNDFEKELFGVVASAYADVRQEVSPSRKGSGGYVRLSFVEGGKKEEWHNEVKARLIDDLIGLQEQGVLLDDIGILVRKRTEAKEVVQTLLDYKKANPNTPYRFDVVSDEALEVASSKAVQFLLTALRYIENPASVTGRFQLVLQMEQLRLRQSQADDIDMDQLADNDDNPLFSELTRVPRNSLYEMCEALVAKFSTLFGEEDKIFVQSFLDIVLDFGSNENQELTLFLEWWEGFGVKRKIAIPNTRDAIRIMTIHKSKGLEFKHVIIPFCHWNTDLDASKENILWCRPSVAPFNNFTYLPVRYESALGGTIFREEYYAERVYAFIDNLNALYVALTRSREQMIIYAPLLNTKDSFSTISGILHQCFVGELPQEGICDLVFGEPVSVAAGKKEPENEEKSPPLYVADKGNRLRLRLKKGFSFGQNDSKRAAGIFMHKVLSEIKDYNDIEPVVAELVASGDIEAAHAGKLTGLLNEKMEHPRVREWFAPEKETLLEHPILSSRGIKIPDRIVVDKATGAAIVIDYKFGDIESSNYLKQVENYCSLMRQMGYKEVNGYLWYLGLDKIIAV